MNIHITNEQMEKILEHYDEFENKSYEGKKYKQMDFDLIYIVLFDDCLSVNVNIELWLKWHIEIIQEDDEIGLEIPTFKLIRGNKYKPSVRYTMFQDVLQTLNHEMYQVEELLKVIK